MLHYNNWGKGIRLGNYLFQYATLTAICKTNNLDIEYPADYFLWNYLKECPTLTYNKDYEEEIIFHDHLYFGYNAENKNSLVNYLINNKHRLLNISVNASFQSQKWFENELDIVKQALTFKDDVLDNVKNKYSEFFTKKTIGIGIRRGDFVNHGSFFQLPTDWYLNVLNNVFPDYKENYNVVVFSDDIEWCKQHFAGQNFLYADANDTYKTDDASYFKDPMDQFILGTLMDNFIGSNSTFSWWQMWYVKTFNNGTVVHCGKNLSSREDNRLPNPFYYPENWLHYAV